MRYININELDLPDDWNEKVQNLNNQLSTATTDEERSNIISKNEIWRDLLVPLSRLSNGKCWYSEAQDVMSDKDVDHFRPKKEAKNVNEIPRGDEEGYWWLCYDFENYRLSSEYSNRPRKDKYDKKKPRGGKWNYFPLFEGSIVAKNKPRCQDEEIMLLDPCDQDDPALLTFDNKGKAIPNSSAVLDDRDKIRVNTSIRLYNLDHTPLEELREQIWGTCQRLIDEIRAISNDPNGVSNFGRNRAKFLKEEIKRMVNRDVELSAVAIACCEENDLPFLTEPR